MEQVASEASGRLKRDVGLAGAVLLGLGAILGSGVFVSLALAVDAAGSAVMLAVAVAAAVAVCNGMSSAELAASHPVSGGTYEYGYRWLSPSLGFAAGWLFLSAKSASAATAALGFAGYFLQLTGWAGPGRLVPLALAAVAAAVLLTLAGVRRANAANAVLVAATVSALLLFVWAGWPPGGTAVRTTDWSWPDAAEACALLFVAYTGYGRVATLGEEIQDPGRNIPRAVWLTLAVSAVLYLAVAWVLLHADLQADEAASASAVLNRAAPLERAAEGFQPTWVRAVVGWAAAAAMLGVLLNLVLGLSRVALAMGRRGDLPKRLGELSPRDQSPRSAVLFCGVLIGCLTLLGDVKAAWSFSAFTVLVYYALTNLAALRLPVEHRRWPRLFAWLGLLSCLFLAPWVDVRAWSAGSTLLAVGMLGRWIAVRRRS